MWNVPKIKSSKQLTVLIYILCAPDMFTYETFWRILQKFIYIFANISLSHKIFDNILNFAKTKYVFAVFLHRKLIHLQLQKKYAINSERLQVKDIQKVFLFHNLSKNLTDFSTQHDIWSWRLFVKILKVRETLWKQLTCTRIVMAY